MAKRYEQLKERVLRRIAGGKALKKTKGYGPEKWYISDKIIHVRFCNNPKGDSNSSQYIYPFNINPNTLKADYELWICGNENRYYLIPTNIMQWLYDQPNTYPDRTNPSLCVVEVDTDLHKCRYCRNSIYDRSLCFRTYYLATFE